MVKSNMTIEKIELNSYALQTRKIFGVDDQTPIDILGLLHELRDITIVYFPMSGGFSGLCRRSGTKGLVAINSNSTIGRQRFTAAHELFHLHFQPNKKSFLCSVDIEHPTNDDEKNADAFASYLLAPYDALKMYISDCLHKDKGSIVLNDVIRIEQHFQMSRQATLWRLVTENFISNEFANTMRSSVILSAMKLGFDNTLYSPGPENRREYTTGRFIELVEKMRERDLITSGKYDEMLIAANRPDIAYNLGDESELYD